MTDINNSNNCISVRSTDSTNKYYLNLNNTLINQAELSYLRFDYGIQLKNLISYLVQCKTFLISTIRRAIHKFLASKQSSITDSANNQSFIYTATKPSGLNVEEMFNATLFQSGTHALHPSSYNLKVDRLTHYHILSCPRCSTIGSLMPQCYFNSMLKCITHGWRPPFMTHKIIPKYNVQGNYSSISLYSESVDKEFQDMLHHGVLIRHQSRPSTISSPLGAIIKNSDKMRAATLVNITIKDQASLSAASTALLAIDQPKVKCRITTDSTASGLNHACYSPSFQYPGLADAVFLIKRDCYMAIGDLSRYFHSFPLALDDRHLYGITYGGSSYVYVRCWFGLSSCPYYCSTWSAEFRRMAHALGILTGHMMDDWILSATSLQQAIATMLRLTNMFEDIGLVMAVEKFRYGQLLVYLGVLIDTTTMTIRFDPTQAKGMRIQLSQYLAQIIIGKHLDHTTIRHVCGKLNWYSEVVQSGRIHLKSWWLYERYGKLLSKSSLMRLVQDTQWWLSLLSSWEHNLDNSLSTYPILSAEVLHLNPSLVYCIQSDASGPDGFGYYHSKLDEKDPTYFSKRWEPPLQDDERHNSHAFEMLALEHFLCHDCIISRCILIWISDSESAVYSINKGSCKNDLSFITLESILRQCDLLKISLIAIWIPRDQNTLADYLSHLATNLNISSIRGKLSEIVAKPL